MPSISFKSRSSWNVNARKALILVFFATVAAHLLVHRFDVVHSQQATLPSNPNETTREKAPTRSSQIGVGVVGGGEMPRTLSVSHERKIWLGGPEIALTVAYVRKARSYVEWGSGGSNITFRKLESGPTGSIEHNAQWCKSMLTRIADAGLSVDLRCVPVTQWTSDGT